MYCGDETGSFIGDVGSHTSRFGYGGEDIPSYVVPSMVAVASEEDGTASKSNKKAIIPHSCYSPRWCNNNDGNKFTMKTPMRTVECPDAQKPVTDPVQFLPQGDSIRDWDAYEHLWMNALDAMYVKETLKHSTGGRDTTTTTTAASGVQSAAIRSVSSLADSKCVHPLLVISPGHTHSVVGADSDFSSSSTSGRTGAAARRELLHVTELMMETMGATALFVAPTPMLAAFSHGRQTCFVVDVGASGTRVTPVVDGLVLQQAQRRTGRGGNWLGHVQWQALSSTDSLNDHNKITLRPRYQVSANTRRQTAAAAPIQTKDPATTTTDNNSNGIFHRWAMQDLMHELRTCEHVALPQWWYDTTVPFCYEATDDGSSSASGAGMAIDGTTIFPTKYFELPDGTKVDLTTRTGKDLCRIPELFFSEQCPFTGLLSDEQKSASQAILNEHPTLSNLPLHKLVHSSLSAVADVDARKDLAASILLTGGSSVIVNLEKRLSLELTRITSAAYKCKVLASRFNVERQCAAWIGGSVLTSLGSFQQLWLSKTEYEEYGGTLAIQRFP